MYKKEKTTLIMQEGQLLCGLEILQRWSGKIIFMIDAENYYKNEDKSYIKLKKRGSNIKLYTIWWDCIQ